MFFKDTAKKTVDSVMAAFKQTIADLETVSIEHLAEADEAEQARREAEARRDACRGEAARATEVAVRLKELLIVD